MQTTTCKIKRSINRVIEKVRSPGTSKAITIPKKDAYEPFRNAPYVAVDLIYENGHPIMRVELVQGES